MNKIWRLLERALFWIVLVVGVIWVVLAFYVQITPPLLYLLWVAAVAAFIVICRLRRSSRWRAWAGYASCAIAIFAWYQTITPSNDRDWAPEVSRNVSSRIDGNIVHLSNIRDFDWQTPEHSTQKWISGDYDLDQIETIEMATSVWSNPNIAHLLVTFGFQDGRHVVFSAEIRRERTEAFNEIGGFFRQFELALIAATENDIIRLRTQVRRENVSLYPLNLTKEQMREMFLSYAGLAKTLQEKPTFYNTITANCTTVVWRLAHVLSPHLPVKASLILSGNLPSYLEGLGVLGLTGSLAEREAGAHLDPNAIAHRLEQGVPYSAAIRP